MRKKLAVWTVGSLLFISPAFALAQTTDNSSQITALLALIQQLTQQIKQLQAGRSTACVDVSSTLTLGSTGSDVTSLQNYLIQKGYLTANTTGYYGFKTASAVGQMQIDLGLVSSQSDTAYGIFGPKTRVAVGCGGNQVSNVPVQITNNPTATIDQGSLMTTDGNPATITGTASKVSSVYIEITSLSSADPAGTVEESPTPIPITNGRWSTGALYGKGGFTPGTYAVSVENGMNGLQLAQGTLTIVDSPSTLSCAISTDKALYNYGDTIGLSWASTGASYVAFVSDTSGKDNLNPTQLGGKLSANGQASFVATVSGNPTITLAAYNTIGSVSYCTKTIPVGAAASPSLSFASPSSGSTFTLVNERLQHQNAIPITYNFMNAPANSQVIMSYTAVNVSVTTGIGGGTWQSQQISGNGTGSYPLTTGGLGSGYTDLPGTYSITAKIRQCDPNGCHYNYPGDDSLPVYASAGPIQITLVSPSIVTSTTTAANSGTTINSSSLYQRPGTSFSMSGTTNYADGSTMLVVLVPAAYTGSRDYKTVMAMSPDNRTAAVANGSWSTNVPFNAYPESEYTVLVYNMNGAAVLQTTGLLEFTYKG